MALKERIKAFVKTRSISEGTFEKNVGLSKGHISNIGDSLRKKTLDQISLKYPELNISWLLTGEGEMFKAEIKKVDDSLDEPIKNVVAEEGKDEDFKDKYYRQLEATNKALQTQLDIIAKQADAILKNADAVTKHAETLLSQQQTIYRLSQNNNGHSGNMSAPSSM